MIMKSAAPSNRIASVDAYRGFVMFLMMAEVLELAHVSRALPQSSFWSFLAYHQSHVPWVGCSLHDLIQPSFSFLVGVALPFSLASRLARGQKTSWAIVHAAWRALVLVLLGIFLRSIGRPHTNFTFEDTLTQIGLGYLPLFLLGFAPPKGQWLALGAILAGYWAAFALYPLPGSDFDYVRAGVPSDWPYQLSGFAAHWNKNTNLAWAFDGWFLNLFPREKPFTNNGGGYATLSFIPTLATMILGLIAGDWLRGPGSPWQKVRRLILAGVLFLGAGLLCHYLGICPIVKRIWTPAWTLYSGGWCFLLLAGFYAIIDAVGLRAWSFPLRVIGMNSIAAYCIAHLFHSFIMGSFKTHNAVLARSLEWLVDTLTFGSVRIGLGEDLFQTWGPAYQPLAMGAAVLVVYWLILYWMYRRGIFLKI
jgi:predicted acyltransferase